MGHIHSTTALSLHPGGAWWHSHRAVHSNPLQGFQAGTEVGRLNKPCQKMWELLGRPFDR